MSAASPTAYPLQWPTGWPKTEARLRESAKFQTTLSAALTFLQEEVRRMGGRNLVLSSNYTLGITNPKEPGVCAYFEWKDGGYKPAVGNTYTSIAIPCDRWQKIEHNVKAIALTIEAMRGMDRWGAKHMIKAMFTGFKALPQTASKRTAHEVLGISPNATRGAIDEAYRAKAKTCHPDAGGTHEAFIELQHAYEEITR